MVNSIKKPLLVCFGIIQCVCLLAQSELSAPKKVSLLGSVGIYARSPAIFMGTSSHDASGFWYQNSMNERISVAGPGVSVGLGINFNQIDLLLKYEAGLKYWIRNSDNNSGKNIHRFMMDHFLTLRKGFYKDRKVSGFVSLGGAALSTLSGYQQTIQRPGEASMTYAHEDVIVKAGFVGGGIRFRNFDIGINAFITNKITQRKHNTWKEGAGIIPELKMEYRFGFKKLR